MIGDSGSDIRAAHEAKIHSIAVLWGWQSPQTLIAHLPDQTAKTVTELTDAITPPRVLKAVDIEFR